jgi:hypothetical protein
VAFKDFVVTPERVSEACGYIEMISLISNDRVMAFRLAPRFAVEENDEYSMKIEYDDNGLISKIIGFEDTAVSISQVTPKRLEKFMDELCEAARNVVNPMKGKGSGGRTATEQPQPLPG